MALNLSLDGMNLIEVEEFNSFSLIRSRHQKKQGISNSFINRIRQKTGILSACRMPDITDLWSIKAYKRVKNEKPWDIVISSLGPYTVHGIAQKMKKNGLTKRWIADYRDLWNENHVYGGLFPFTIIEKFLEKHWLKHADTITTVSEGLKKSLQKISFNIPVSVIMNGFNPNLIDDAPINIKQDKFQIIYTGTIYEQKRDPTPLFIAINELLEEKSLNRDSLEILFFGKQSKSIENLKEHFSLMGVVRQMGEVNQIKSFTVQKSADALLFLEAPGKKHNGVLTGKLFEYLYSGKPIIGIGIDAKSASGNIIEGTNSGVVCGVDSEKIKSMILSLINKSYQKKQNRNLIMEYTRENQAKKIYSLLISIV